MAGVTVVEDLDAENLLEHLCLEEEAKEVRGWVAEKTPRPAGLDKRLSSAAKLRGKGNVAYERKEWDAAVWLYLAALHHVDYSLKDSRADKLGDSVVGTAKLQEEVARVCANLAAAFSAKDDAYNAARSAALPTYATVLRPGAQRSNSRCQCGYVESGTTMSAGARMPYRSLSSRTKATVCSVLPRPISSARIDERRWCQLYSSHATPSFW